MNVRDPSCLDGVRWVGKIRGLKSAAGRGRGIACTLAGNAGSIIERRRTDQEVIDGHPEP